MPRSDDLEVWPEVSLRLRATAAATLFFVLSSTLHPALAWAATSEARPLTASDFEPQSAPLRDDLPAASNQKAAELDANATASSLAALDAARVNALSATAKVAEPPAAAALADTGGITAKAAEPPAAASLPAQTLALASSLPASAGTVSSMGESFTTQPTTGAALLSVPISLPAARGLAQPLLSLNYSSLSGPGSAGIGWSVEGTAISRQTSRGTPSYDDRPDWHIAQDTFVMGSAELVPICTVVGTSCTGAQVGEAMPSWADGWQYFRSRVESSFLRFFWKPDHQTWRVQAKSGVEMEFGVALDDPANTSGIQDDPDGSGAVFAWHLIRQYDAHTRAGADGVPRPVNVVRYNYASSDGATWLTDIYDTPAASTPTTTDTFRFAHHARLVYEDRPDPVTSYASGWRISERKRVTRIDVTSNRFTDAVGTKRELLRRYYLSYLPGSHFSLLTSIQVEGRCGTLREDATGALGTSACTRLPPMELEYQHVSGEDLPYAEDAAGLAYEPLTTSVRSMVSSPPYSLGASNVAMFDVNSDGLSDVLITNPATFSGGHGLYLGTKAGGLGAFQSVQTMTITGSVDAREADLRLVNPNMNLLDLDGSGAIDIVHMPQSTKYSAYRAMPSGAGWTWEGRTITVPTGQSPRVNFTQDAKRVARADVNGDGLIDILFSSANVLKTYLALGRHPGGDARFGTADRVAPGVSTLSPEPIESCLPWSSTGLDFSNPEWSLADMNGDSLVDVVRVRDGQILYWPGRGNGYFGTGSRPTWKAEQMGPEAVSECPNGFLQDRHITMDNAPVLQGDNSSKVMFSDVNGDGLTDIVHVSPVDVGVYFNENGERWTALTTVDLPGFSPVANVQLADANGSGTADVIWGDAFQYRYLDLSEGAQPRLLSAVHNGLGKTTRLEYTLSTDLMLAAAAGKAPWTRTMGSAVPVLTRSTLSDNLELAGLPAGSYPTQYNYRDPLYDGLQREFKGFEVAETTQPPDGTVPGQTSVVTYLLGSCTASAGLGPSCSPTDVWLDNWRDALKGQPFTTEVRDSTGKYLSTTYRSYELRQLYSGRDGRRVMVAYPNAGGSYAYDTDNFDGAETDVWVPLVNNLLTGQSPIPESRSLKRRSSSGTALTKQASTYDAFGNVLTQTDLGCVAGCSVVDEALTTQATVGQPPGDLSGWLTVQLSSWRFGSVDATRRNEVRRTYNAKGDVLGATAILSGSLPLVRSHAQGRAIAAAPPTAAPLAANSVITLATNVVDDFGNMTSTKGAGGRCSAVGFDTQFAQLPVSQTTFTGLQGAADCGTTALTSSVNYDRGFAATVSGTTANGQPYVRVLDGFGRLTSARDADPAKPGSLATLSSLVISYDVPVSFRARPYAVVLRKTQDGANPNTNSYRSSYSLVDGLGRTILKMDQADTTAGDGGKWIASGLTFYDTHGNPKSQCRAWFSNATPTVTPWANRPVVPCASVSRDGFGRTVSVFGRDGSERARVKYHAMSEDQYDAGDLASSGPHAGTYGTTARDGHGRTIRKTRRIRVGTALEEHNILREFQSTGELRRVVQRRTGSPDVARWMLYDTLGRMVFNAEPNTAKQFTPTWSATPGNVKGWRYAYSNAGELVGTSDARGCGVNFSFDRTGRPTYEDYSPCDSTQPDYTPLNSSSGAGAEVMYRYDVADADTATAVDSLTNGVVTPANLLLGRLVSVSDRASKTIFQYDALGRTTGTAVRVVKPGGSGLAFADRYAPRWYVKKATLDAASRSLVASTGATAPEFLEAGKSEITTQYSKRGTVRSVASSYGSLVNQLTVDQEGLPLGYVFGDVANTQRTFDYDALFRPTRVLTFRATPQLWSSAGYPAPTTGVPTQQLSLEDDSFKYDEVGNVASVTDNRASASVSPDWPTTAQPVSKSFEYDDLYRLKKVTYSYPTNGAPWSDPNADEAAGSSVLPRVSFVERPRQQTFSYDYLGNLTSNTDDQNGFYDRSLGTLSYGGGPNQLTSATNRATSGTRKGDLVAAYDASGNLSDLIVKRDGPCVGASCWQRFRYEWDEIGQLSTARRWDLTVANSERVNNVTTASPLPPRVADAATSFAYDAGRARVLRSRSIAGGAPTYTVYVFQGLELRNTTWQVGAAPPDYANDAQVTMLTISAGATTARVVYSLAARPTPTMSARRVFLLLSDRLGGTKFIIDRETSELVEAPTYQAFGASDSDYRPSRWGAYREATRFAGKEDELELGLEYFGKRYYAPSLGRWASPDPLEIHGAAGELNPYMYARQNPASAGDQDGLFIVESMIVAGLIAAAISAGTEVATAVFQGKKPELSAVVAAAGIGFLSGVAGYTLGYVGATVASEAGASSAVVRATAYIVGGATRGMTEAALASVVTHTDMDGVDYLAAAGKGAGSSLAGWGFGALQEGTTDFGSVKSGDSGLDMAVDDAKSVSMKEAWMRDTVSRDDFSQFAGCGVPPDVAITRTKAGVIGFVNDPNTYSDSWNLSAKGFGMSILVPAATSAGLHWANGDWGKTGADRGVGKGAGPLMEMSAVFLVALGTAAFASAIAVTVTSDRGPGCGAGPDDPRNSYHSGGSYDNSGTGAYPFVNKGLHYELGR